MIPIPGPWRKAEMTIEVERLLCSPRPAEQINHVSINKTSSEYWIVQTFSSRHCIQENLTFSRFYYQQIYYQAKSKSIPKFELYQRHLPFTLKNETLDNHARYHAISCMNTKYSSKIYTFDHNQTALKSIFLNYFSRKLSETWLSDPSDNKITWQLLSSRPGNEPLAQFIIHRWYH